MEQTKSLDVLVYYQHNGVTLKAPLSYTRAPKELVDRVCNGMGSKGRGWMVPDTMYLMDLGEAGNVHDWMYEYGHQGTWDKHTADVVFLDNMLSIIDAKEYPWYLKWLRTLRHRRANTYYWAVSKFGRGFWRGM